MTRWQRSTRPQMYYLPMYVGEEWYLVPIDTDQHIHCHEWLGPFASLREAQRANDDTGDTRMLYAVCGGLVMLAAVLGIVS